MATNLFPFSSAYAAHTQPLSPANPSEIVPLFPSTLLTLNPDFAKRCNKCWEFGHINSNCPNEFRPRPADVPSRGQETRRNRKRKAELDSSTSQKKWKPFSYYDENGLLFNVSGRVFHNHYGADAKTLDAMREEISTLREELRLERQTRIHTFNELRARISALEEKAKARAALAKLGDYDEDKVAGGIKLEYQ